LRNFSFFCVLWALVQAASAQPSLPPSAPPATLPGTQSSLSPGAPPTTATQSALPPLVALPPAGKFDLARSDISSFVDHVVARDALDRKAVLALLGHAEAQPKIIERITKPAERVLEWWEYRQIFVNEKRIAAGAEFWNEHRAPLEHAAAQRGVAPEYIVAILGAETNYGRITGHDRVLDALMTLAFDYAPRQDYFRGELEQFLLLVREERIDPLTVQGSYTGAMGAPQFMPSNYRLYAVDANGDHSRDLWTDWDDVFASIANYFISFGWVSDGPVLTHARLDPDPSFQFDPRNLELNETLDSLNGKGVRVGLSLPPATPAVLVSAEEKDGPAYRVGFQNFYAISRYNHSARYAMAVNDLAEAIAKRVRSAAPPDNSP
jgi:membrane-bound lytic murein transglycosylase B